MLKKARVMLPVLAVVGLIAAVPSSSNADENLFGRCPDGYTPTPFVIGPDEDRNGNGVICVKPYPNGVITHDDPNGQPYRCNGLDPLEVMECQAASEEDGNALIVDDILE